VERLLAELRGTVRALAPAGTSVAAFMRRLRREPANRYRDGDELLAAARAEVHRAAALARAVVPVPREGVTIAPVPRHEEATTAAQYMLIDGDPPRYELQLNTGALLPGQLRHELANLVTHEGYPGHHLAQVVAERQRDLPRFRRRHLDSTFDEGWALYAETLRDEQGGFTPRERVGHLTDQLWRAARLVVDPGLHTGRMRPARAVRYFRAATFSTRATARAEIERYLDDPGQAVAYAYGKRRLLGIRAAVREILGDRFDARRFHARLLRLGAVPLAEAERAMLTWARRRAAQVPRGRR
jgi:uncharacterized protein (DUF885 family)